MSAGVVALLGSGETAPGMTKVHRDLLARRAPVRAVNLDTAYGFQENVPQMTEKLVDYFATSLLTPLTPLHLTSYEDTSPVQRELFKQAVTESTYVFAGPGSPSWALAQWRPLDLASDLAAVLAQGGTVCFASAAALTLGAYTAPIYEIYKVGVATPYWLDGLDLMGRIGLRCAVVPHFDNHEGSNYDTRFCYLGERRLELLEASLPTDVAVFGVDEHTAAIIDLDAGEVTIRGRGHAYWRRGPDTITLTSHRATQLAELGAAPYRDTQEPPRSLTSVDDLEGLARVALAGGDDAPGAIASLVRRASLGQPGLIDPTPLVDALVAMRDGAREHGDYSLSDQIRDALVSIGVEVRDDPTGSHWSLTT
ncbi:MAG: hypothetical protein ACRDV0_02395 [Acidimicrobiales bacterium]